jgi:hypothetical protein
LCFQAQAEARRQTDELLRLEAEKSEGDHEIEKQRARIESLQHEARLMEDSAAAHFHTGVSL